MGNMSHNEAYFLSVFIICRNRPRLCTNLNLKLVLPIWGGDI